MKKAVILDTSAIMYRSHFALQYMKNSKGFPTGAVFGFLNTLNAIIKEMNPDYLVACFDVKRSSLNRSKDLETYKSNRSAMPEELLEQLPKIQDLIDGFNIPKYTIEGYEADDVISTLAEKFSKDDIEVYVVTGDKDLMQLVNDKINIALLGKGEGSNIFGYVKTSEDVLQRLGVVPELIPDLFGLIGDKSDGIPGVSGIGPKTGVQLMEEYNDLDGIYNNIDKIKGKKQENLINEKEMAYLSKKLATVHRDLEIDYDLDKLSYTGNDEEKLISLYKELEFKKQLNNLGSDIKEDNIKLEEMKEFKYNIISNDNELKEIDKILENKISVFEFVTGFGISDSKNNYYVKLNHLSLVDTNVNKEELFKLIEKRNVITYSVKELLNKNININEYFDVMIAWYVLGTEEKSNIENIVMKEFDYSLDSYEDTFKKEDINTYNIDKIAEFVSKRSFFIYKLENVLLEKLKSDNLTDVYFDMELKLIKVLSDMEKEGILIDRDLFDKYSVELKEKINKLEEKIYELAGGEFNINSPKQLATVLFEDLGINPVTKTKTGYSTNVEVLEILNNQNIEIASFILEYRTYTKLLSTYVEALPKSIKEDGRIHTTFNQNGTATGRLSSTDPNLQNIPARTEEGIKIRRGFVSKEGFSLISFDYSQIELRVLAELSQDSELINAYEKNLDLHDLTSRKIFFKSDEDEVTREERALAKIINFSILYGKTPFGLSKEMNISIADAKLYIDRYFEQYPKVKVFIDKVLNDAELNGFVETSYGTRRYIKGITSKNKNIKSQADRMAVNTVVQGTAANILKKVMIEIHNKIQNESDIKMLLQVHDELIFEVKDESVDKYLIIIKDLMENTIKLNHLKIVAQGSVAKNWGDLK